MPTTSCRFWFRFSLRFAFFVFSVLALALAIVGNHLHQHYAERRSAFEIESAGGYVASTLLGWLSDDNPERWEGGPKWLGRIVFIRLSGSDIDDEHLTRLDLQHCEHLRGLSIGYDAVFGLDGPKWETMPAPITDHGIVKLPPFPKLQQLNLWDLPVGDAGLIGLAQKYPQLEAIDFSGTRVTDLTMTEVGKLGQLEQLNLRKTLITDDGLVHLAGLMKLKLLTLSEVTITGHGLAHLNGMSHLTMLDVRDTGVADDAAPHIASLRQLSSLILWGTNVGDDGIAHIATLKELRYLNLTDTNVTNIGVKHLDQLRQLSDLSLIGTSVTDVGLADLAGMPQLKHVSLDRTGVTMIGIEDFLRREPDRTVLYNSKILYANDLSPMPNVR